MVEGPKEEGGFLSRWSRRKAGAEPAKEAEAPPTEETPDEEEAARLRAEEENRKAAEAVDLSQLSYESDYGLFLKPGVPGALRDQALRRLWRSNPLLANLDGLNDYDEDFTTPAGAAATVVKTLWKVHGGYPDEPKEKEPRAEAAEGEEAVEASSEPPSQSTSLRLPEEDGDAAREESDEAAAAPAAETPTEEEETAESADPPRVSLRRRLDLEAFKESDET